MNKKLKKVLLVFGILILVVLTIGVLFLGYLGFIPGVAALFGADQPRDLGVEYTQADLESYTDKAGEKIVILEEEDVPDEESISRSGEVEIDDVFTQEEITARLNNSPWRYFPLSDVQVRLNDDGTVEASAIFNLDRVYGFAAASGYSREEVDKAKSALKLALTNPPVYAKGSISVTNNRVSLDVDKAEIGRFSVPLGQYNVEQGLEGVIQRVIDKAIEQSPSTDIVSVDREDGQCHIRGTFPDTTTVVE